MIDYNNLLRKLFIGFGFGIVVFIALVLYGDVREMGRLLQDFRWGLMPAILGLTIVNYLVRGARFHYYLLKLGVNNIGLWTSLRIFVGGFALTLTPGKFGELVRVLWLKNLVNADPVKVAPATVVDRIVDGLTMAILASLGALAYPQYWPAVAVILTVLVAGIIIVQIRPLALWCLNFGEKLPLVARFVHHLHTLYESAYELLRFKNLLVGLGAGLIGWSAEGVAFYLVLIGLGVPNSFNLTLLAIFTLAIGSLLGGASSSPGGLGAAEASMAGILRTVINLSENVAATATLLIRFFTLWFGVGLGILTVIIWRKMLFGPNMDQPGPGIDKNLELVDSELTYEQAS